SGGLRNLGVKGSERHFSPTFRRIAMLLRKLGADPRPLSPLPPRPRRHLSCVYHDRLVAELARPEEMAYGDVARLHADLDQRAKVEGRAMTETDKSRHDQIPHVRLLARSPRVIVGISIADVNAAVDGKMVKLDNRYRVDLAAGHLCLNERSAAMLGTDAPL